MLQITQNKGLQQKSKRNIVDILKFMDTCVMENGVLIANKQLNLSISVTF
jgi:hypothetical protein